MRVWARALHSCFVQTWTYLHIWEKRSTQLMCHFSFTSSQTFPISLFLCLSLSPSLYLCFSLLFIFTYILCVVKLIQSPQYQNVYTVDCMCFSCSLRDLPPTMHNFQKHKHSFTREMLLNQPRYHFTSFLKIIYTKIYIFFVIFEVHKSFYRFFFCLHYDFPSNSDKRKRK